MSNMLNELVNELMGGAPVEPEPVVTIVQLEEPVVEEVTPVEEDNEVLQDLDIIIQNYNAGLRGGAKKIITGGVKYSYLPNGSFP